MREQLTELERNALNWVQFLKYWDKLRADETTRDEVKFTLLRTRIAIQRDERR